LESESDVASESEVKEQYMKQIEAMQQIEVILRQVLEPEAKERLSNIKVVNQEMYYKVAQFILQL
jgi:DNA-binding TFAR19-related protein (PDSD5 family)